MAMEFAWPPLFVGHVIHHHGNNNGMSHMKGVYRLWPSCGTCTLLACCVLLISTPCEWTSIPIILLHPKKQCMFSCIGCCTCVCLPILQTCGTHLNQLDPDSSHVYTFQSVDVHLTCAHVWVPCSMHTCKRTCMYMYTYMYVHVHVHVCTCNDLYIIVAVVLYFTCPWTQQKEQSTMPVTQRWLHSRYTGP